MTTRHAEAFAQAAQLALDNGMTTVFTVSFGLDGATIYVLGTDARGDLLGGRAFDATAGISWGGFDPEAADQLIEAILARE